MSMTANVAPMIRVPAAARAAHRIADFLDTLSLWRRRLEERRAIAALDDRLLRDIGMAREVAEREAVKPFWEA
jgi:uncharacterized protein YjiS (DUF1127 family)